MLNDFNPRRATELGDCRISGDKLEQMGIRQKVYLVNASVGQHNRCSGQYSDPETSQKVEIPVLRDRNLEGEMNYSTPRGCVYGF